MTPDEPPEATTDPPRGPRGVHRRIAFELVRQRLFARDSGSAAIGRFVVLGTLGRGGMGTVYKAYDALLDRAVAIKLLHSTTSERHADRLQREAQALAKLSHPNVVHVYEVGEAEGRWFIAMELVAGRTLREWHAGAHDWRTCVRMYLEVGTGLAAAHAEGLVHRDFKPDNCIVDEHGRPRVLDFGLVREVGATTGAEAGTHGYMPPEQRLGHPADARSDQFSFCVSLHEALHGARPFAEEAGARTSPATPRGTRVPDSVRQIVARGLASDPAARWPSMDALLTELRRRVAPRTRRWLALGLAVGLATVGAGLAWLAEVGFRCEGAQARLDGVWDEDRRVQVHDAILATGVTYAADTWSRTHSRLDDYAQGWRDKHVEVCEATSVRQEQSAAVMDLRMECLRDRRQALQQVVDVLASATALRVENAVELVASLPPLARCDDVEALRAELPPPEDPAVGEQVQAERQRLQGASALRHVGEYEQAQALVDEVVEAAQTLAYVPLLAEAMLERGMVYRERGDYAAAGRALEQAYELAAEHGHDTPEALAAAWLIEVNGVQGARHEEGLWWGRTAAALARGRGVDEALEGRVEVNVGSVLKELGRQPEALERFRRAVEIFERTLGPAHPDLAMALGRVASVLRDQNELDEALVHSRRALAIIEEALGPGHPHVAASLNAVGTVLKRRGELDEALVYLRRMLAIQEATLGPDHPSVGAAWNNVGNVLQAQGKLDQALFAQHRALEIWERALGPKHPAVATSLHNLGSLLAQRRELDEALVYLERALVIRDEVLGPLHPDVASTLTNIGVVLGYQNQLERTLPYLERSLEIETQTGEPDGLAVALLENNLGVALRDLGRPQEARDHLHRALKIREQKLAPDHIEIARALSGLADVALALGEHDEARRLAERAIEICEPVAAGPDVLAWSRFVLAQVLWAEGGRQAQAQALARQALAAFAELGVTSTKSHLAVEAWLLAHGPR